MLLSGEEGHRRQAILASLPHLGSMNRQHAQDPCAFPLIGLYPSHEFALSLRASSAEPVLDRRIVGPSEGALRRLRTTAGEDRPRELAETNSACGGPIVT